MTVEDRARGLGYGIADVLAVGQHGVERGDRTAVAADGEDVSDPVAEAARAILDGHIILSRRLAESGHFPAIDLEASISRVMHQVVVPEHEANARSFRHLWSLHEQNRDLLSVGAYKAGSNPDLDRAIAMLPRMRAFLRQDMREKVAMPETLAQLHALIDAGKAG